MTVKEAVAARQSIRAYKTDPIPRKILEEIVEQALRAPSWGNTQPWGLTIVGGQALKKIREEYVSRTKAGVPHNPDFPPPTTFNEKQTERYKGLGKGLFLAQGIARDDREKRTAYVLDMFDFFGAPNILYLHLEKGFHPYALMDGGVLLQTIALLAVQQGLGTCFLAVSVSYPDVVRQVTGMGVEQTLVMGMAIGYPVADHPANLFRSPRGKTEEFISWVDGN
jgi:nitroreductase